MPEEEKWGYWEGMIFEVKKSVAKGEGNYGPWALHIITGVDGSQFSTFEISEAEFAENVGGQPVLIDWEISRKGYKNITCIQPAVQKEPDQICGCPLEFCSCGGVE